MRAVGANAGKLKVGDRVCCLRPHHFDTSVLVDESRCEALWSHENGEDMIGQIHPLIVALQVATLLRLSHGNRVLVDCQQEHLAYMITQVALLRGGDVHVTYHSDTGLNPLHDFDGKTSLVDRQTALRQSSSSKFFDAIITDSRENFQLLDNVIKPGGRVLALGSSVSAEMTTAATYLLRKGVTIGVFDPMDGLATLQPHHSR